LLFIYFKELLEHRISENQRNVSLFAHRVSISKDFEGRNLRRPSEQDIDGTNKYLQTRDLGIIEKVTL